MSDATPAGGAAAGADTAADPFARGQREAEALREAMDGLREDVGAMVREEVSRVGMSTADLERLVRDAVSRELRRGRAAESPWRNAAFAAVGVVVGVVGGAIGYAAFAGGGDVPAEPAPTAEASPPAGVEEEPVGAAGATDAPAPSPAERAALYDSLLDAGSDGLAPMVDRLEAAGPAAPVSAAIETWRSGAMLDAAARRRLHDALVQLALNEEAGAGLALDGLLTRNPCRGNSCGALLELWRARGPELGMPELPAEPASDTPTLAVAERVLVLGRAEAR